MNTAPPFTNQPCSSCGAKGSFDLTTDFLCLDCWQKRSARLAETVLPKSEKQKVAGFMVEFGVTVDPLLACGRSDWQQVARQQIDLQDFLEEKRLSRLSREVERKSMVTAKFKVQEIRLTEGSRVVLGADGKPEKDANNRDKYAPCEMKTIIMHPVYGNGDPNHENTKFWQATPSGKFELNCVNPGASDQFAVGQEWLFSMEKV